MRSRIGRRGAAITAATFATLGLAAAGSNAAFLDLPPGAQVNDDAAAGIDAGRDAGVSDVVGGALAAGGLRVPWATFEQKTAGEQQIFVRSFKNGRWTTQGNPASLNIDKNKEAEAPSIDFAGADRTVPWVSWYEPNDHLGTATNIFASRFNAAANVWVPEGQDRAPNNKVPSLNIHTDRDAENPAVAGGATVAGNAPVPWVAWQERDGGAANDTSPNQIFVSKGIKNTDCSANLPGGGTSVSNFCWQQVGLKRITKAAAAPAGATDPTLNVDPTRDGIEPDFAFTGPGDTVPWVVWYEQGTSKIGLRDNEQVFAAKAVADASADGGFHWQVVGLRTQGKTDILDTSGAHGFGTSASSIAEEDAATQNAAPDRDAEDPRVATGTLTPGGVTVPWVAWAEVLPNGNHGIFVSRLVGGDHFELANNGQPVSNPDLDASRPDITFSGNTPYVSWHTTVDGKLKTVVGHFEGLTTFKVDGRLDPVDADVRSPISSSDTADPFTQDGAAAPGGAIGTPFVLHTTEGSPQRLLAHSYAPTDVVTGDVSGVTPTTAHLTGSVNPAGAAVRAAFEYGTSTAYGSRTADQTIGVATTPQAFAADLSGLPPSTAIHYRSVVTSDFGTFSGPDRVFVTTPAGGGNGGHDNQGQPHRTHNKHRPIISTRTLKLSKKGTVAVRLTCPSTGGKKCVGTLKLSYKGHTLAKRAFTLKGGHSATFTLKLAPKDRRAVRHSAKGLKIKVTAGTSSVTRVLKA